MENPHAIDLYASALPFRSPATQNEDEAQDNAVSESLRTICVGVDHVDPS
jgi:hypothetical protein